MALSEKHCVPCSGGVERFTQVAAQAMRDTQTPHWTLENDATWLRRRFEFSNWKDAFAFVSRVSEIAEAEKHHPDISFGWGYAEIRIQTHKIGGLHENDFILAARIDAA